MSRCCRRRCRRSTRLQAARARLRRTTQRSGLHQRVPRRASRTPFRFCRPCSVETAALRARLAVGSSSPSRRCSFLPLCSLSPCLGALGHGAWAGSTALPLCSTGSRLSRPSS
eukprot:Amastigsp_a16922_24.p2 type:complete len:113 gc:universal Amastigsp_a16922_24:408-70(-)